MSRTSPCGKTTLARTILWLQRADAGEVRFRGEPVRCDIRAPGALPARVQMDFQDPTSALNARQTVYEAVAEGLRIRKSPATRSSSSRRRPRAPGCGRPSASSPATRPGSRPGAAFIRAGRSSRRARRSGPGSRAVAAGEDLGLRPVPDRAAGSVHGAAYHAVHAPGRAAEAQARAAIRPGLG